jgi:hypothetical protein
MESIVLKKLKAIINAQYEIEIAHLDDYEDLIEWKLLQSNKDLIWSILDEYKPNPEEDFKIFQSDAEKLEEAEVNEIIEYIKGDL